MSLPPDKTDERTDQFVGRARFRSGECWKPLEMRENVAQASACRRRGSVVVSSRDRVLKTRNDSEALEYDCKKIPGKRMR